MANIRKAASLLVANKASKLHQPTFTIKPEENYNLLFLTRSSKNRFMPNAVVFPGGAYDAAADSSPRWWQVLESAGCSRNAVLEQFRYPQGSVRPTIYSDDSASKSCNDVLPPELSLRVCALRETFEETGLLLGFEPKTERKMVLSDARETVKGKTLAQWREEIQKDPSNYAELFHCLSPFVPWLWGLVEWWGWLTPLFMKVRFDTIFYTACIYDEIDPNNLSTCSENDHLRFIPPSVQIGAWHAGDCWLAPPQVYELGRLAHFSALDELEKSIEKRVVEGGSRCAPSEIWLPQIYGLNDGAVTVLPGDYLYSSTYPFSDHAGQQDGLLTVSHKNNPSLNISAKDFRTWLPSVSPSHTGALQALAQGLQSRTSSGELSLNRGEIGEGGISLLTNGEGRLGQVLPKNISPKKFSKKD